MCRLFGQSCLLDSNVPLHALDRDSRHFQQTAALLACCVEGNVAGLVARQNLLELVHALTARYRVPLSDTLSDVEALSNHPSLPMIAPDGATLALFWQYVEAPRRGKADIFDLYLAATARQNGLTSIVTANAMGFVDLPRLEVVELSTLVVE